MLTAKSGIDEIKRWDLKAKNLAKDLERTFRDISDILEAGKENLINLTEKKIIKKEPKANKNEVKKIIKTGIMNLRKSVSPLSHKVDSCQNNTKYKPTEKSLILIPNRISKDNSKTPRPKTSTRSRCKLITL